VVAAAFCALRHSSSADQSTTIRQPAHVKLAGVRWSIR
jgi:hypothetical protein